MKKLLFLALLTLGVISCAPTNNQYYRVVKGYAGDKEIFAVRPTGRPFIITDTTNRHVYLYQIRPDFTLDSLRIASW